MAAQRRRKGGEVESDYIKYLKYKNTGFQVSASDKTLAWWPTKDADRAFCHVEVTKDDGKNFTVRLENGEVRKSLFTSTTTTTLMLFSSVPTRASLRIHGPPETGEDEAPKICR
jgi:hypothetical protein